MPVSRLGFSAAILVQVGGTDDCRHNPIGGSLAASFDRFWVPGGGLYPLPGQCVAQSSQKGLAWAVTRKFRVQKHVCASCAVAQCCCPRQLHDLVVSGARASGSIVFCPIGAVARKYLLIFFHAVQVSLARCNSQNADKQPGKSCCVQHCRRTGPAAPPCPGSG